MHTTRDVTSPTDRGSVKIESIELAAASPLVTNTSRIGRDISLHPEKSRHTRGESAKPLMKSISQTSTGTTDDATEKDLPLGQAIRQYPKVVAYCLLLTIIVIGWGYALVIVGTIVAVESFQHDYGEIYEGEWIIPSLWVSLWSASIPLGMALGSIFAGWFQDRVGRRMSLRAGSVICAIGVAGIFFSYLPANINAMRAMFFTGKVVQGLSIGILKVTAMTYISETAPTALRGSAMGLVPTGNLVGQLLGSIVLFFLNKTPQRAGYLAAFGSQWLLAVVPFILSIVIPESPAYLEERGESDRAVDSARRLYAPRVDALRVLEKIRASIAEERESSVGATYISCFVGTHRRRTMIVVLANLFPAMFGLDLISKSSYFLQVIGMKSSTSLIILILGIVVGTIANGAGLWILSRAGRRKVTLVSLSIAAVLWVGVSISGFWRGEAVAYFTAAGCVLIIVVCGMGVWPAAYAIMGETSSLRLRAKTQGIGGVINQGASVVMSIVLPYCFNRDAGDMGAKTGFIYVGLCGLAVVLSFYYLPEMKGRSVIEIDHMFNIKLPARQFKGWKGDTGTE
ncbi:MFS transporter fmqE [Colletotrichum spinosum]|uniref:MFS transporter fmqE n=1 Tax=Colletotrichum spinosum TaxID=1347390 RepID=A0A4R8QEJ2_9PEZI|nr:MFS transporter fmqE [Colletotrichum spinosum]